MSEYFFLLGSESDSAPNSEAKPWQRRGRGGHPAVHAAPILLPAAHVHDHEH